MKLNELIQPLFAVQSIKDCIINGISLNSKLINPGDLFIACRGQQYDARLFIDIAVKKGAHAIIREGDVLQSDLLSSGIPVITVPHLSRYTSRLSARFYGDPSQTMNVIGITGTNGKTSTCHYIASLLHASNRRVAIMGTVGNGFFNELKTATHTTSDAVTTQAMMKSFNDQHATDVVIEVSSHGLIQHRVDGVQFQTAVFTNLTRDHLDYHGTMENYAHAKQRLFTDFPLKQAVFNIDDEWGSQLYQSSRFQRPSFSYSLKNPAADISAYQIELNPKGITAQINSQWGKGLLQTSCIGHFNLANLLATIATLCGQGYALDHLLQHIPAISPVAGRMQLIRLPHGASVVVDYAHTPDALEKALIAIKHHCEGNLWCVFGCGGDRDPGKRPQMGRIAEQYADHIIVTDDNPRHEASGDIIKQIVAGIQQPELVFIEPNRVRAIEYAISHAKSHDMILIAGKGHEDYQQIGDEKIFYSDIETVRRFL